MDENIITDLGLDDFYRHDAHTYEYCINGLINEIDEIDISELIWDVELNEKNIPK